MPGTLTTHVLDIAAGKPAAGVRIELYRVEGEETRFVAATVTDRDGRTGASLLSAETVLAGVYELRFHIGDYFSDPDGFLGTVPVRFRIGDPAAHYHIPLLCSPWAYSTYRGS